MDGAGGAALRAVAAGPRYTVRAVPVAVVTEALQPEKRAQAAYEPGWAGRDRAPAVRPPTGHMRSR